MCPSGIQLVAVAGTLMMRGTFVYIVSRTKSGSLGREIVKGGPNRSRKPLKLSVRGMAHRNPHQTLSRHRTVGQKVIRKEEKVFVSENGISAQCKRVVPDRIKGEGET